jgi:hypothetical protein
MKWWKSKKYEQDRPEEFKEPADLLEVFSFIQKALAQLSQIKGDVKSNSMNISQLRRENELLKVQISLLEEMMKSEL